MEQREYQLVLDHTPSFVSVWYVYKVDQHALILILEVSQYPKCYLAQIQSLHLHFELSTTASYHQGSLKYHPLELRAHCCSLPQSHTWIWHIFWVVL